LPASVHQASAAGSASSLIFDLSIELREPYFPIDSTRTGGGVPAPPRTRPVYVSEDTPNTWVRPAAIRWWR
jgi:hypothetical protein